MTNYTKTSVGADPRVELHDVLNLTGAEVSITLLPAGQEIPFIHAHKLNEEIYGILEERVAPPLTEKMFLSSRATGYVYLPPLSDSSALRLTAM